MKAITTNAYSIKGWVQCSHANPPVIASSYNVTGVSYVDSNRITITWDTDFADDKYVVVATNNVSPAQPIRVYSIAAGTVTLSCSGGAQWHVIAIGNQ